MKKLSDQNKINLVNLYMQGIEVPALSSQFNVTRAAIRSILRVRKIPLRSMEITHRKYKFNDTFFEKIDTEAKAYFLGFLYADGYISQKYNNIVSLQLQERDKEILDKLKHLIQSERPLYFKKSKKLKEQNLWGLQISSKKMTTDLKGLGCGENKSLTLKFPILKVVSEPFIRHFMRGYFDGDGCICIRKVKNHYCYWFSIISSLSFCKHVKKILNELKIHSIIRNHYSTKGIADVIAYRKQDILILYNFLYEDATIFLERKKRKFEECCVAIQE